VNLPKIHAKLEENMSLLLKKTYSQKTAIQNKEQNLRHFTPKTHSELDTFINTVMVSKRNSINLIPGYNNVSCYAYQVGQLLQKECIFKES
jgi:hypothetical protein